MIRISQVVEELLLQDDIALEALRAGILNLSAYAKLLEKRIEKRLYKPVRKGSIVTALSRISQGEVSVAPLKVPVRIEDMTIKSPLCEITFERTREISQRLAAIKSSHAGVNFFTMTQGIGEITSIVSQELLQDITRQVEYPPKGIYRDLAAVTVRFNEQEYIEVPNMLYTLISALAGKRINIIEIVSTYTEVTFVIRQPDMRRTVDVLKEEFFQ